MASSEWKCVAAELHAAREEAQRVQKDSPASTSVRRLEIKASKLHEMEQELKCKMQRLSDVVQSAETEEQALAKHHAELQASSS